MSERPPGFLPPDPFQSKSAPAARPASASAVPTGTPYDDTKPAVHAHWGSTGTVLGPSTSAGLAPLPPSLTRGRSGPGLSGIPQSTMDGSTFASSGRLAAAPSSEMRRAASCREADPRGRHAGSSSLPRAGDHRESISHSSYSEDTLPTCPLATRPASERMRASNEEAEGSTRGPRTLIPPSTGGTSCTAMSPAEDGLLSSCVVARQEAELDQQLLQILPTVVSMSLQGTRPRAAGTTSDKEIVRLLLEQGVVLTNVVFNLKAHAASEASAYEYVSKLRREQSADRMAEVDLLGSGSTEHGDPRSTPAPLAFGGWSEGQVYASGYAEPNFARMPPGYAASASGEGPADLTLPFERANAAVAEHRATQAEVQRMLAAAGPNRDALETLVQFVQNAEGPYCSVAECFCACSTTFPFLNYRRIVSRYMQHARLHLEAAVTMSGFETEWFSLVEAERASLAERTGDQCALDLSQPLAPRAAQAGPPAAVSTALTHPSHQSVEIASPPTAWSQPEPCMQAHGCGLTVPAVGHSSTAPTLGPYYLCTRSTRTHTFTR